MDSNFILSGGLIHTATGEPFLGDIRVENGKIAEISATISAAGVKTIDQAGVKFFTGTIDGLYAGGADCR